MVLGIVKWFNSIKGFGFIQLDDGFMDVFVYIFVVECVGMGLFIEGQKICYEVFQDCCLGKSVVGNLQVG